MALTHSDIFDYIFFDHQNFFQAVLGYYPEFWDMNNGRLIEAIDSEDLAQMNFGLYLLQVKESLAHKSSKKDPLCFNLELPLLKRAKPGTPVQELKNTKLEFVFKSDSDDDQDLTFHQPNAMVNYYCFSSDDKNNFKISENIIESISNFFGRKIEDGNPDQLETVISMINVLIASSLVTKKVVF